MEADTGGINVARIITDKRTSKAPARLYADQAKEPVRAASRPYLIPI